MKIFPFIFALIITSLGFSQVDISLIERVNKTKDSLVSTDNFNFFYYMNQQELIKKKSSKTFNYSNLALGKIEHINTFNPLKTFVFYKDMNALIVLDNRLAPLATINFNRLNDLKLVSHLSPAYKNFLWLYNTSTLRLELFDFITNENVLQTNPIAENILDIDSDYNYVWLLSNKKLYCYNYRGLLLYSLQNDNYTEVKASNENIFFKKENSISYYNKITKETQELPFKHQLINSFFVSQQNLYIYDSNTLYKYKINF